jgi:Fe2+ transport system protein B|tara:strand:- start:232 stop:582 length:351 start_codon:yes stop_codon:yes gene_type:complete
MSDKPSIRSLLELIDAKISHIEDMEADNRAVIIKLVKQTNQIVTFLKQIEIDDVTDEFDDFISPRLQEQEGITTNKIRTIKELVDEFMDKQKDLKEFEEELKKHKDDITPGKIGEA